MMNGTEANQAERELIYGKPNSPERAHYYTERKRIVEEFKAFLFKEEAFHLTPAVQQLVWAKAWNEGHSEGYGRIEDVFTEYCDFIDSVKAAS